MEFFHKPTNFPFMATRRVWYGLSIILMIVSIVSLATRGLNLATDFTGGVTVGATFPKTADTDAVRARLAAAGFRDAQVQNFGSSRDIAIRAKIEPVLKSVDPGAQVESVEVIGPQVGGELERSAAWALAFTLFGIFIYIAFRFHTWRLSLGAIVAVIHDPVLVLGIFSLDRTSFDLPVVAAVLAVVGYSLNDTVVVFDRIRERFHAARRLPSATVLDQSINQTLSRTIMTKVVK